MDSSATEYVCHPDRRRSGRDASRQADEPAAVRYSRERISTDEFTHGGLPVSNRGTCVYVLNRSVGAPLGPREAFIVAHERLQSLAGIAPEGALVIAAVSPEARVVEAFQIADRTAVIVGRHTNCGLRLALDTVSLRHLAVLARSECGQPVAHVWDLNTPSPSVTEDGQSTSAVVADGPAYLAVGEYALWIVPAQAAARWPSGAADAWAMMPARQFVDRREPSSASVARQVPPSTPYPSRGFAEITRVTSLGPPLLVGDGDDPEVGWGTLRFEISGQKEKRHVSAERLGQGILVGRYDRCGMSFRQCENVSRVHLLLVRIGDELWAIDAASTNGVKRAGVTITAEVLSDDDALTLSRELTVQWHRQKHAQA